MNTAPNIFSYATSELSQDAFICWLLAWAAPENESIDKNLHQCGITFIAALFAKGGKKLPDNINKVDVLKQDQNIDVLCIVNDTFPIIIEDKTNTDHHSDQLERYYNEVAKRGYETNNIIPIFYKTFDQCNYETVRAAGYKQFTRADMLAVIEPFRVTADSILRDYIDTLKQQEEEVSSFADLPLNEWRHLSWVGFFKELHVAFPEAWWGWVNNLNGGFWYFGFAWKGNAGLSIEHDPKRNIGSLGIKIKEKDKSKQSTTRNQWSWDAIRLAKEEGTIFKKPKRFGKGENMTVAVTESSYRKQDPDTGLIDMKATIAFLKKTKNLLDIISRNRSD